MPGSRPNGSEKLQPPRRILHRPTQIIESPNELIKRRQVRMIGRLHIQPIELPLTFYGIPRRQRPRDPVRQRHHRVVKKQIHLRRILCRQIASPHELVQLRVTADPQRTPSFVMFGNPDYFFQTTGSPAIAENAGFAYNHGGIQPEITTTWMGLVGPGVKVGKTDDSTFADETDYRPTMLSLLGLRDDYQHEGRVLAEELEPWALPNAVSDDEDAFVELATAFKEINAPLGQLGKDTLKISTVALNGSDKNDATYNRLERQLSDIGTVRDALADRMLKMLEDAEFNGNRITEREARPLVAEAFLLAAYVHLLEQVTSH